MAYLVDIQTTTYYRDVVRKVIEKVKIEFYSFMERDPDSRKERIRKIIQDELQWDQWCVADEEPPEQLQEIVALILEDVMTQFLEDLQTVVKKILGLPLGQDATVPVSVAVPPEPAVPPVDPRSEPPIYPAPDANSMALDPVDSKGMEIPPLQTRNFYTMPKAERAKLMPKVSVDADDKSWLNYSVYNKGD